MPNARQTLPQEVSFANSMLEAIKESECVIILTEWNEYRDENLYQGKAVIDGRRTLDPQKVKTICDYQGICW